MNTRRFVRSFPNPRVIHDLDLIRDFLASGEGNREKFLCLWQSAIGEQNFVLVIRKGAQFFRHETCIILCDIYGVVSDCAYLHC
ncbi:hypothetical protein PoB_006633400 [Plakobranchus ocellatus]|uniref:Uncharacterized protein n=1 Tax=Plakobranchus ocellatus TaxID=259542 RepID=A0AAV4D6L4_9GAST|nr:hypothetical protein PoB_006633400 [Plakobranchus ocellatus]